MGEWLSFNPHKKTAPSARADLGLFFYSYRVHYLICPDKSEAGQITYKENDHSS